MYNIVAMHLKDNQFGIATSIHTKNHNKLLYWRSIEKAYPIKSRSKNLLIHH